LPDMALHLTASISTHDLTVKASARGYQTRGFEALICNQPSPRLFSEHAFDIFVPELRRVEEIETGESLAGLDLARLRRCREEALQVWVLVPTDAISAAHARLKGAVDHIVPYWLVGGERVRFGPPRLP
jgi:hypothetical protein